MAKYVDTFSKKVLLLLQLPYQDYLTVGQMKPRLDLQQDWKLINCSEENGVTTLLFSRAKNTSDDNDTAVQVKFLILSKLNVIYS